jgi:hypothetical protein
MQVLLSRQQNVVLKLVVCILLRVLGQVQGFRLIQHSVALDGKPELEQDVGQNRDIKIANRSFENVPQLKYFETTVTNQNLIQEEIKKRLKSGNACYHSVQNLLPSRLLSKNLKIRLYKTVILPVVLYGCETWCPTSHRLGVFENKVLWRIFGPKRDEVIG